LNHPEFKLIVTEKNRDEEMQELSSNKVHSVQMSKFQVKH